MAKRRPKAVDERPLRFFTKVVGVTYPNDDGSSRQKIIGRCRAGESLKLVRDPRNEYDRNAIAVCRRNGQQLGHLSSEVAAELAPRIDAGQAFGAQVKDLTGGGWLTKRTRGVNVEVFTQESALPQGRSLLWLALKALALLVIGLIVLFAAVGIIFGKG